MKIVLATGIYPPEIGGPATYVKALAKELVVRGNEVSVISYVGKMQNSECKMQNDEWKVVRVSGFIPFVRWILYALALRRLGKNADVVIAFSSISTGIPIWFSGISKPKKILRLGGDFFWERSTALGGMLGLRDWYESKGGKNPILHFAFCILHSFMSKLLGKFDHIVFSTKFQEKIYEDHYPKLPSHSVLENALPSGSPVLHQKHDPFRLLFMGRFVGFKNLPALIEAVNEMDGVTLTLVGDGPMKSKLKKVARENISFRSPIHGEEKPRVFAEHDLMVIPSITEVSPNVALEARARGLPVLLTKETGLSDNLVSGMAVKELLSAEKISEAIYDMISRYPEIAENAASCPPERGWSEVAGEWLKLLSSSR